MQCIRSKTSYLSRSLVLWSIVSVQRSLLKRLAFIALCLWSFNDFDQPFTNRLTFFSSPLIERLTFLAFRLKKFCNRLTFRPIRLHTSPNRLTLLLIRLNGRGIRLNAYGKRLCIRLTSVYNPFFLPVKRKSVSVRFRFPGHMCFPGEGTDITRDMCFPGGGTRITSSP